MEILKECKLVSKYRIFAYCIMSNHVHLLLKIKKEELEQIFRRIGARYVYWYNKKYDRCGHLFQDRFKSEAVEDDAYLLTVLRYIIQNPQKVGITDGLEEYEWSSHKDYLGRKGITDTGYILSIISDDVKRQVKIYKNYINKENEDQCLDIEVKKKRITDDELYILIKDRFHIKPQMIQNESREKMRGIIKEILRIDGVSRG